MSESHSDIEYPNTSRYITRNISSLSNTESDSTIEREEVQIAVSNEPNNSVIQELYLDNDYDECKLSKENIEKSDNVDNGILESSIDSIANDECIICLEKGGLSDNYLCENKCQFKYHIHCYIEWLSRSNLNRCLVCKEPILKELNYIVNASSVENSSELDERSNYNSDDNLQADDNNQEGANSRVNQSNQNCFILCRISCREKFNRFLLSPYEYKTDILLMLIVFVSVILLMYFVFM